VCNRGVLAEKSAAFGRMEQFGRMETTGADIAIVKY
jgi:hypothetical protein